MIKTFDNPKIKRALLILAALAAVALLIYFVTHGQHYFTRRNIRQIQKLITSFGFWSPVAVISLIFLSTVIPPLPMPVPLIETAAGLTFGFGEGFILVWVAQIGSSFLAFKIAGFFGKHLFNNVLSNHLWNPYRHFIEKKGPWAVFITRATMASPFNITSFLAGITQMKALQFTLATVAGTIPEVALYVFIGSRLRNIHLSLWHLFIFMVLIGVTGALITYLMMRFIQPVAKSATVN